MTRTADFNDNIEILGASEMVGSAITVGGSSATGSSAVFLKEYADSMLFSQPSVGSLLLLNLFKFELLSAIILSTQKKGEFIK